MEKSLMFAGEGLVARLRNDPFGVRLILGKSTDTSKPFGLSSFDSGFPPLRFESLSVGRENRSCWAVEKYPSPDSDNRKRSGDCGSEAASLVNTLMAVLPRSLVAS